MSRKSRTYTDEFKQEAVKLALKSGSISKTARELGMPMATLHTWVRKIDKTAAKSLNSSTSVSPDIAILLEENRRLHKELAMIREEKEILKKAAAYFAVHQK